MQEPFWLPIWQAIASILSIATESALVLPVMLFVCLFLGRRRQRVAMAQAGMLLHSIALVTACFGLCAVLGEGLVSLVAIPAAMPDLVPAPFEPLSETWLATTTGFAAWLAGLMLLAASWRAARPVYRTCFVEMDEATASSMTTYGTIAAFVAAAAFFLFAGSLVLRNWPFLGLPAQMTQENVLTVLVKHVWKTACAAFMPAGGLAVLTFFLQLEPVSKSVKTLDRKKRAEAVIPGTAEDIIPFSDVQKTTLRMCAAFAIAGAVFQFLDASFTAFNPLASSMGSSLRALSMRFGPFVCTAVSIVCWGILFARPRRHHFLLALLPVLLLFLRAAARF